MLAMLPSPVSHHDNRHVPVLSTSTLTFSRTSASSASGQMRNSRPTLTINTAIQSSKARSFGKGSSLSIHTLSAVSPTTKNTFANTYQSTSISSPITSQRPTLNTQAIVNRNVTSNPEDSTTPTNSSLLAAAIPSREQHNSNPSHSTSTGVSSILITSVTYKTSQTAMSNKSRPDYSSKRVSFRDPLVEEIKTLKYVLAHSDLESSITGDENLDFDTPYSNSTATSNSAQSRQSGRNEASHSTNFTNESSNTIANGPARPLQRRNSSPRPKSSHLKRDSSSEDEDSDDAAAVPQTPVAGRCKRRREWTWTLDTLPGHKSAATIEEPPASNDDDSVSTSSRFSESSTG